MLDVTRNLFSAYTGQLAKLNGLGNAYPRQPARSQRAREWRLPHAEPHRGGAPLRRPAAGSGEGERLFVSGERDGAALDEPHPPIELLTAWGFTFKSAGAWAKQSSTGECWAFGTGYVFRSAAEFYLVGAIGKPRVGSRSIRNLIAAPVREPSRKPDQLHADVEALYAGPYAELFARQRRPGWDAWGNQVGKFDDAG